MAYPELPWSVRLLPSPGSWLFVGKILRVPAEPPRDREKQRRPFRTLSWDFPVEHSSASIPLEATSAGSSPSVVSLPFSDGL